MARTQIERQYIGQQALVASASNRFNVDFPLGELWYAMHLRIAATATIAASPVGGVAYEDPLLELINNIRLEVDRDGVLVNAPGKALYAKGWIDKGTAPNMDEASFAANTAAAYAMSVHIPIYFADPRALRPEDTALATDRYSSMQLSIGTGAGADMLSTAHSSGGGITLSAMTCDVEIEKAQGPIRENGYPVAVQKLQLEGSAIDTSATTVYALQRSPKRAIKRLYNFCSNLGVSARPFSGNGNTATLNTLAVESDQKAHDQNRRASQIRDDNKQAYGVETLMAGLHIFDYVRDASLLSALATGDKARLEVQLAEVSSGAPSGTRRLAVMTQAVEDFGA